MMQHRDAHAEVCFVFATSVRVFGSSEEVPAGQHLREGPFMSTGNTRRGRHVTVYIGFVREVQVF